MQGILEMGGASMQVTFMLPPSHRSFLSSGSGDSDEDGPSSMHGASRASHEKHTGHGKSLLQGRDAGGVQEQQQEKFVFVHSQAGDGHGSGSGQDAEHASEKAGPRAVGASTTQVHVDVGEAAAAPAARLPLPGESTHQSAARACSSLSCQFD